MGGWVGVGQCALALHPSNNGIGPGALDLEGLGRCLHQWPTQEQLCQKGAQSHRRIDDSGNQRGRTGIEFGHDHRTDGLRFQRQVGTSLHHHGRIDTFHLQIIAAGNALLNRHVTAQVVKAEALAEDIPKIQDQSARQGLQAQHTQQFGDTGISLEELTAFDVDQKSAAEGGVVDADRGAEPAHLPLHLAAATAHHVFHAKPSQ